MMTDTRIYGRYVPDYGPVCNGCFTNGKAFDATDWDEAFKAGAGSLPLYSVEDDGNGETCTECGEWIFEPYFDRVYVETLDLADEVSGVDGTEDEISDALEGVLVVRSIDTDRLFRLTPRKYVDSSPTHGGPQCRVSSPKPGRSTLTTSAPRSASSIVA